MNERHRADICIVGAGLTGLLAARAAVARGLNTIVIERGEDYHPPAQPERRKLVRQGWWDSAVQCVGAGPAEGVQHYRNLWPGAEQYFTDLAEIEAVGAPWDFKYNMRFGVGGSARVWSGLAWRLHPDDFMTRSRYGHGVDWPVTYAELAPFYDEAEGLLEVAGQSDLPPEHWPWRNNYRYPAFAQSYCDHVLQRAFGQDALLVPQPHAVRNRSMDDGGCIGAKTCVQRCPTTAIFHPDERWLPDLLFNPRFAVLTNCCVSHLEVGPQGRIAAAHGQWNGEQVVVEADRFALCANGLESIRLCLRSREKDNAFMKRVGSLVGRHFASHGALVYRVEFCEPVWPSRGRPTTSSAIDWLYGDHRRETGAFSLEVWNSDFDFGYAPWEQAPQIFAKEGHWGHTLLARLGSYERRINVAFAFEMDMPAEKHVTLGARRDRYGLALARALTPLTERDSRTIERVRETAGRLLSRAPIAGYSEIGCGLNGNHPLGGLRMGRSCSDGVVDADGVAFDHSNLLILGGSSFCGTGSLNPTLTITALALRSLARGRFWSG